MSQPAASRLYAGETSEQRQGGRRVRLVEAGIELLGTGGREGTTVRAVCAAARLTPRYFYESFENLDELQVAVLDHVLSGATVQVLAAVDGAPSDVGARTRATIEAFVSFVVDDPRRARIVFAEAFGNEAMMERRQAALAALATLASEQAQALYGSLEGTDPLVRTTALMLAGGVAEVLLAYTAGELDTSREELVADVVALIEATGAAAAAIAVERQG